MKLLVYGPRKSGTTLLQALLDGHPDIFMIPGEFKLKELHKIYSTYPTEPSWHKKYFSEIRTIYRNQHNKNQDYTALSSKISIESFKKEVLNLVTSSTSLVDLISTETELLIGKLYSHNSPKLIAQKEVGGNTEFVIYLFKSLFPDSKILFIARDSRAITSSVVRERRRRGIQMTPKQIVKEFLLASKVNRHMYKINNLSLNTHLVRYEDLVVDTEEVLSSISRYLEINYDPILTQPTLLGEPTVVKTSSQKTKKINKNRKNWREGLRIHEAITIAGCHLLILGIRRLI